MSVMCTYLLVLLEFALEERFRMIYLDNKCHIAVFTILKHEFRLCCLVLLQA